jgi:hypothetical protein
VINEIIKNISDYKLKNVNWTIASSGIWLTTTPTSGSNSATVSVTCNFYLLGGSRIGTITITGGGVSRVIEVQQADWGVY